nr:MAG TPA: hypothetical protein [Caudoviricetes sp.]
MMRYFQIKRGELIYKNLKINVFISNQLIVINSLEKCLSI